MKYSVVIPVYNSEELVEKTITDVVSFFSNEHLKYEILLVNDSSSDKSWDVVKKLAMRNPQIIGINLLKNYGQHNAVLCGFRNCSGDRIITMDDDGQNPASEIIHLIRKMDEGYDCVFGKFYQKKHSFIRRLGSKIVNELNGRIFGKPNDITLTNFRIVTRKIVDRINQYSTSYPYIPGLVIMFSNHIGNVMVEHKARQIGASNYNFFKIIQLVSRLLINYSAFPLRILTGIGIVIALLSFAFGIFLMVRSLFLESRVEGWTSIVVILSFFNGFLIMMLGLIGDYLSRILRQISSPESYQIMEIYRSAEH